MCHFSAIDVSLIIDGITNLVEKGQSFTGYNVWQQLGVMRSTLVDRANNRDVSAKVRELYNGHHLVFKGYASAVIPSNGAAVSMLYFPLPPPVSARIKIIARNISKGKVSPPRAIKYAKATES